MILNEQEKSLMETALSSAMRLWGSQITKAENEKADMSHPVFGMLQDQIKQAEALLEKLQDAGAVELIAEDA